MKSRQTYQNDEYDDEYDDEYFDEGSDIENPVQQLDGEKIILALEEGGEVARRLTHYESRDAQLDLMRLIVKGFNEDALVAAEAGTGVGKSFAYLLPAISFALLNDERVVISTATITLQQQLYEKDIPFVLSALGVKVKTILIKGRGNFICRRRLEETLSDADSLFELNESEEIKKIIEWSETTKTGSKSDLPFMPAVNVWSSVCSESDTCLGMRCNLHENCFVMKMRREAREARILVVNHHLLFADLAARHEGAGYEAFVVLPAYRRIIIDEAHTIENSATSFFSTEWGKPGLLRAIGRLYRRRGTAKKGLLLRLQAFAGGPDGSSEWEKSIDNIRTALDKINDAALFLCGHESVFRLISPRDSMINERLTAHWADLRKYILEWTDIISAMLAIIEKKSENEKGSELFKKGVADESAMLVREVKSCVKNLSSVANSCNNFIEYKKNPESVFYIERHTGKMGRRKTDDWALFIKAPIDISQILKEALFEKNKTVVCLSATLTVVDKFDYWESRCGINGARNEGGGQRLLFRGSFPSPFPYSNAVLLAVPEDAPLPIENTFRDFVNEAVLRLTLISGGSALVLFTSFESLESCYAHSRQHLNEQGILCLKQGDDDRSRLLKIFLEDKNSVLFATDSFWEGVDAPGETLKMVILCRLPFKAPNDPVFQARCEELEKRGMNPFMELSVPEAVMKFRQGFGRLVRRSSDRGVVVVLDGRVIKKRYGALFLRSLPQTKKNFGSLDHILRNVESFLFAVGFNTPPLCGG
jgi:ATP-dependent DNA helicase DinG